MPAEQAVLFSVIVPYRDAAAHLPALLGALVAQDCGGAEYILVDNNSSDASAAIVREFVDAHPEHRFTMAAESTPGPSAARNAGARAARGEWLVFTDADCVPEPGWLTGYAEAIRRHPGESVFSGSVCPGTDGTVVARFSGVFTLLPHTSERTYAAYTLSRGGGQTSANLCVRAALFGSLGGFNPSLRFAEDHDLCARVYRAGHVIRVLVGARVVHNHRSTVGGLVRQAYNFGVAHGYCVRHLAPPVTVVALPRRVLELRTGVAAWLDLNQADKKMLAAVATGLLWWPLALVVPAIFFVYQVLTIGARARTLGVPCAWSERPAFAFLLLAKSAALGAGRLAGAVRYKVLCL